MMPPEKTNYHLSCGTRTMIMLVILSISIQYSFAIETEVSQEFLFFPFHSFFEESSQRSETFSRALYTRGDVAVGNNLFVSSAITMTGRSGRFRCCEETRHGLGRGTCKLICGSSCADTRFWRHTGIPPFPEWRNFSFLSYPTRH